QTPGGDSVWTFNRLMRPLDNTALGGIFAFASARKSHNNLFGARLSWQPGTAEFVLENVGEGAAQAASSLRLRPRAAIGSSWPVASPSGQLATLTSRTWQLISTQPGAPLDSVAVITLGSGQVLRLSQHYGLLAGPRWLATSGTVPAYEMAQLPVSLASSPLNPATLFGWQPGDLLGYDYSQVSLTGPACMSTYTLRRILTRRVVSDSLLITWQQQSRTVSNPGMGCFNTGTTVGTVESGRAAFSLRTGQSGRFAMLPMLSGEYKAVSPLSNVVMVVGLGLAVPQFVDCNVGNKVLPYEHMYNTSSSGGTPTYSTITDYNWFGQFSPATGLGDVRMGETFLRYTSMTRNGLTTTCGSDNNFANLLATHAAQAAEVATLAPNPAAEMATLTLVRPAGPGALLHLTDALGRLVWSAPVAAGETVLRVPLAAQPAGLYLLRLSGSGAAGATWKLLHW
ncbi:MAG: T9SS type A sorting domain-containing protein, partial [Bacteroidota bacterium]|nr:T9SS type A sorting domain-containing protein [Bacteroidota bacterium]